MNDSIAISGFALDRSLIFSTSLQKKKKKLNTVQISQR